MENGLLLLTLELITPKEIFSSCSRLAFPKYGGYVSRLEKISYDGSSSGGAVDVGPASDIADGKVIKAREITYASNFSFRS